MGDEFIRQRALQQEQWTNVSRTILTTLRQAAKTAVDLHLIDASQADKYFISGHIDWVNAEINS